MATYYPSITDEQADLIRQAPLFFVATADPTTEAISDKVGPINLSPKGGVPLHILDPHRVAYLDYAGSGDETARHTLAGSPITIMVCSFDAENAAIVRLYGRATITPVEESPLKEKLLAHGAKELKLTPRHVIEVVVEKTVTSCGYGVPIMEFVQDRTTAERGRQFKANRKSL